MESIIYLTLDVSACVPGTLVGMDCEPLRMADGLVWYLHYDEVTHLHTIAITTAQGGVRTRMTMTEDQLRDFADNPHELYARVRETVPEKIIDEPSG